MNSTAAPNGGLSSEQIAEAVAWRRHLHQHPELAYKERETSDFIASQLGQFGSMTSLADSPRISRSRPSLKGVSACAMSFQLTGSLIAAPKRPATLRSYRHTSGVVYP